MELLGPAAQRAATDLFALTHQRPGLPATKQDFYEVTLVQFFYQHLLMSPSLHGRSIQWEVPFSATGGNPKRVDLALHSPSGAPQDEQLLLEVGRYAAVKLKEDTEKLRDLQDHGTHVKGYKRVLLYWLGPDAPKSAAAVREAIRKPMANAASRARVGPSHIRPLWVTGCELYAQSAGSKTRFSAVMVEVSP